MDSTRTNDLQALRAARGSLLLYRLLFPVMFTLALPFYLLRMRRRERGRAGNLKPEGYHLGIAQRLGFYQEREREWFKSGNVVWVHSISVGETLVALKLARQIHALDATKRIVLSTTTSTGFELALGAANEADWLLAIYNPVDFQGASRRAIHAIRPEQVILIEGEVWPNLVSHCRRKGIAVTLANARLSRRSEARFLKVTRWTGPVFRLLNSIFVQDINDVARFVGIGALPEQVRHLGSIKYDQHNPGSSPRFAEFGALLGSIGFKEPLLVAGSTWAPEEKLLAECLLAARAKFPQLKMVLVPRHVERSGEIARELRELGLNVTLRSSLDTAVGADVLIVDATGELQDWYPFGTVVFVGKSMPGIAQKGGQNLGEPAALGVPVVCGPHMGNFQPLVTELLQRGGLAQVADAESLREVIPALIEDAERRKKMSAAAAEVMLGHQGATNRTAMCLLERTPAG